MNRHLTLPFAVLVGITLLLSAWPTHPEAQAQEDERCFSETVYCIRGPIREFWERYGGISVFGAPISYLQPQRVEGRVLLVQWFERNRLELHPEGVMLGRLGDEALQQQGRSWHDFPTSGPQEGCRYFDIGYNVCDDILAAWQSNGLPGTFDPNVALFGIPLSPQQPERLSDGNWYHAQWFERARFELHPENPPPYNVLLGLLGSEVQCPGVIDPKNSGIRPGKCFNHREVAEFDIFHFQAWEPIKVEIMTEDGDIVDTQEITAREDGQVYAFLYDTVGLYPGLWRAVFRGRAGSFASAAFRLLEDPCPDVRNPTNVRIRPAKCVAQGERLTIESYGFQAGETINVTIKDPNGATRNQTASASDNGLARFRYNTAPLTAGTWSITLNGATSGHSATVYFEVFTI